MSRRPYVPTEGSSTARLFDRIRRDLPEAGLPADARFHQSNAGRWQRAAGAWSWSAEDERGWELCGSPYPVVALLAAPVIVLYHPAWSAAPEVLPD